MEPYINLIENFDAALDYTVEYTFLGSERVLVNELSIRENKQGSLPIYTKQSTKYDKNHKIPKGTLTNGKNYAAKIRVKISDTAWSDWSPEITFICLATPVLQFQSLDSKNYVYNDDIMMTVVYRQEQGEIIDTYQLSLLDQNNLLITEYPTRVPDPKTPNILSERVNGLVKGRLYHIACRVITKNGINYQGIKEFIPHYIAPSIDGVLSVIPQEGSGQVLIQSVLKQLLGTQTRPNVIDPTSTITNLNYMFDSQKEKVIIPKNRPLMYERLGMAKSSDWVAKIWCEKITDGRFLYFTKINGESITMTFVKHKEYITCEKEFVGLKSRTKSNTVPNLGLGAFYLYIKVVEFRVQMTIEPITTKR